MEQGYVAQAPGRADRRQRLLTLTPGRAGAGAPAVRAPAGAAGGRLSRRRRRRGGWVSPGDARHHGRAARAYLDTRRRGRATRGPDAAATGLGSWTEDAHILVVDDDARLRALLSRYSTDKGFRVTTAENAADARAKLRLSVPT